jgi:broad specificity phosphatase PhoE
MRIGVIRHFKVNHKPKSEMMNSGQFNEWIEAYNYSGVIPPDNINCDDDWDICFSSNLKRAEVTAGLIYSGTIIKINNLREVEIKISKSTGIKLHYIIWLLINRIGWHFSRKSQDETNSRAKKCINLVETSNYQNVLLVSHGAFMRYLHKELRRRKYKGKMRLVPRNGELIVYTKIENEEEDQGNE